VLGTLLTITLSALNRPFPTASHNFLLLPLKHFRQDGAPSLPGRKRVSNEVRRLRDPIHGLIVFRLDNDVDHLAWRLIQTPEFQRLRRIRQLGVSEFVFPGATHTRFAHSVGVFYMAKRLMEVIRREEGNASDKKGRASVALIAALLHDLGHGPFSHAFEAARKAIAKDRGIETVKSHEQFTAELIRAEDGDIFPILRKEMAESVADLIQADEPKDIYHAVVSSSFDADRLDYLMRDRYMTGIGAGAIDYDWLMDNLTTQTLSIPQDDDSVQVPTFVFRNKGRQAAEDFLLARYRLYTQVYLHKTTRGFEQLLSALFRRLATASAAGQDVGLDASHPLMRFLAPGGDILPNYRGLDDAVVWGAIERLRCGPIAETAEVARRLWERKPLRVLDVFAEMGHDDTDYRNAVKRLQKFSHEKLEKTIFWDSASYNLYSETGGEMSKAHKCVRVLTGNGSAKEISQFPDTVINSELMRERRMDRVYFLTAEDRAQAEKAMKG
jgi:HD superfamily phosphohydrolase